MLRTAVSEGTDNQPPSLRLLVLRVLDIVFGSVGAGHGYTGGSWLVWSSTTGAYSQPCVNLLSMSCRWPSPLPRGCGGGPVDTVPAQVNGRVSE